MAFNTALSGLRSASSELSIIGNNIANASTVGFKKARAEFVDVYASSLIGAGQAPIGSGVLMQSVTQQFAQGNVSFTDNGMDMAINGGGFFILDDSGAQVYSRSGMFSVDRDGYIVNPVNQRLQGFPADDQGVVGVALGDLQIQADTIAPQQTTQVETRVNLDAGEPVLAIRGTTAQTLGSQISVPQVGTVNNYVAESMDFDNSGNVTTVTTTTNAMASATAAQFSALDGVSASATTTAQITGFSNVGGTTTITLNGVDITADNPLALVTNINNFSNTTLPGITASENAGVITVVSSTGVDLRFEMNAAGTGSMTIDGMVNGVAVGAPQVLSSGGNQAITLGGVIDLTLDENIQLGTGGGNIFNAGSVNQIAFINNSFDPNNPNSFNSATSINVYDSLGNAHVATQYFVKEPSVNTWTMYVLVDGRDVGDPNAALPPPQNIDPTRASFNLVFNNDGTLDQTASDQILISYWNPVDDSGNPTGALNGLPVASGGALPVPTPATSSNFEIQLTGSTQFGSPFAVNDIRQNGYTTGRLTSIDVAETGDIFARFSNGQSQVLGRVALAHFTNPQGLSPQGESAWAESFESGQPVVGNPGTASLGIIQSSALEDSNVELSEELVALIVAQRNFQANAKTVQTADAITQTIINIR